MVSGLVKDWNKVVLPKMVLVKQNFHKDKKIDITKELRSQLDSYKLVDRLKPKSKIAVAVGSRGIKDIDIITKETINILKDCNFEPFIVPAMGSHGGATESGQIQILNALGITEEKMGVPIISSLEVVEIGRVTIPSASLDFPVFIDKVAYNSDGIVVINRVKPHTLFRHEVESGLMKMLTIGLGKHMGATIAHRNGFDIFHEVIPAVGSKILENAPIYFGVAIVENAFEETSEIKIVPKEDFLEEEKRLLIKAKSIMGKIKLSDLNLLIVKQIGKEFSGDGMDPNVTGRYCNPSIKPDINIQRIVVLDVSEKNHGNATGIGAADIITKRCFEKIDLLSTYVNAYTATTLRGSQIPFIIDSDEEAIQVALTSCVRFNKNKPRIVYIPNTLYLEHLWISEDLVEEIKDSPDFEIIGKPEEMLFDLEGNIINLPI